RWGGRWRRPGPPRRRRTRRRGRRWGQGRGGHHRDGRPPHGAPRRGGRRGGAGPDPPDGGRGDGPRGDAPSHLTSHVVSVIERTAHRLPRGNAGRVGPYRLTTPPAKPAPDPGTCPGGGRRCCATLPP